MPHPPISDRIRQKTYDNAINVQFIRDNKIDEERPHYMTFGTLGEGFLENLCFLCTPGIQFLEQASDHILRV